MTSTTKGLTTVPTEILKTDCKGRIRFPAKMREELLDHFEIGGMSGAEFAAYYGIKYSTFASWRQKRERKRKKAAGEPDGCRLVEIILQEEAKSAGMRIALPGGASVEITNKAEAALAAELLKALETRTC